MSAILATFIMISIVLAAGASISLLSVSPPQGQFSRPDMQTSAETTNSTLGLELSLSLNSTSLVYGQGINITIELQNVLDNPITLPYPTTAWAPPFKLPANLTDPCFELYNFRIYSGYYTRDNISSANLNQTLWVFPMLFGCHARYGKLTIQPRSDIDTETGNNVPLVFSYAENQYLPNPGPSGPPSPLPVGVHTTVAGDAWGQVVLLHFEVSPPAPASSPAPSP